MVLVASSYLAVSTFSEHFIEQISIGYRINPKLKHLSNLVSFLNQNPLDGRMACVTFHLYHSLPTFLSPPLRIGARHLHSGRPNPLCDTCEPCLSLEFALLPSHWYVLMNQASITEGWHCSEIQYLVASHGDRSQSGKG